jgi:ParB family protein
MSGGKLGAPNPTGGGASRRSTIDTLFVRKADPTNSAVASDNGRVRTGAISAMGTSLMEMTEGAKSAARLQQQIDTGAAIIEIEPGDIDASMVTDRLAADIDPSFDDLVESMRGSGQQVPILVRPSPGAADRYQIAYGRRRSAQRETRRQSEGSRRPLTDDELVIAQGKENLDRRDLSYIEKALFARRLEDQGFDRTVIMTALSTDKGDLSRYITVARAIPERVARAIGPAGRAGRARWTALADRLAMPRTEKAVDSALRATSLDASTAMAALHCCSAP